MLAFKNVIREVAGNKGEKRLTDSLQTLQRIFQVSPTPEALAQLLDAGLTSAYQIANIPEQSFLQQYGEKLGEETALIVHKKASYQLSRVQDIAMRLYEYSHLPVPQTIS